MRIILSFCLAISHKDEISANAVVKGMKNKPEIINQKDETPPKLEATKCEILAAISKKTKFFSISYTLPFDSSPTHIEGMYYQDAARVRRRLKFSW